ncbi:MAG: helix-turn-helix domain-containing protein [Alphaproteobacteria bacterium]
MSENKHLGSSFDDFLAEEGILDESSTVAQKRVLAWQLAEAMKARHVTRAQMAERMHTSRTALNRLLDPDNPSVTLATMGRAAAALGMRLQIQLVDAAP